MPIIAGYALIALTIFGAGFGVAYKYEHAQVEVLNLQIQVSNETARKELLESVTATERAEQEAQVTSIQLESEYAKSIKLSGDLSSSLATVRMRVPAKRSGCSNALPKDSSTTVPADTTDYYDLPEDLAGLLRSEAIRADNAAAYGQECYKFVTANCGVQQ